MRNNRPSPSFVAALAALGISALPAGTARGDEVDLLPPQMPWRAFFAQVAIAPAKSDPVPPASWAAPPADWMKPDFDDSAWARYLDDLPDLLGQLKGGGGGRSTALLLRTRFGISDPRQARDLKVTVTGSGGGAVYVNGREVGNAAAVEIPPGALVRGRNVLAIELRHPVGFQSVRLTSASGGGVISPAEAFRGTRVWSASPVEPVSETVPERPPAKQNWFHGLVWTRGMPVKGVPLGNPFDPPAPIWMAVPRNGVCSGQAVLSDPAGLRGIVATVSDFRGPGGACIRAADAQLRYAVQRAGVDYCDALMEKPPENAKTVPVWLVMRAGKDQTPGWYTSALDLQASGRKFSVPVQVLVSGFTVADAKDLACPIRLTQSPETLALQYKVAPWSDAHWALMEKSLALLGQAGNKVVNVPVILGTFRVGRGLTPAKVNRSDWRFPLVRWVKTDRGPQPEFSLLEKYLDVYLKHCAPPQALCLYLWDSAYAKQVADIYEGRRIPSRALSPQGEPRVQLWDPKTGETSEIPAPHFDAEGADAFWKPMLDGARALVTKRGWPERAILLGLGGDLRPSLQTGEVLRAWAPYARWNLLSHFSGDPSPKDGRLIAGGNLEIGLKEWPWRICGGALPVSGWEESVLHPQDFLDMPTARWHHQEFSPPITFRTLPLLWGSLSWLGLDFWLPGKGGGPGNTSFFVHVNALTAPGPDGAVPTVRFQMLREAAQDVDVRMAMIRAYLKLPEAERQPYRALLDEFPRRVALGAGGPSNCELSYDWLGYVARLYLAAGELAGVKTDARWDQPPR
jgi:hypothetical protein